MVARGRETGLSTQCLRAVVLRIRQPARTCPVLNELDGIRASAFARPLCCGEQREVAADFQNAAARSHNRQRRAWLIASLHHAC